MSVIVLDFSRVKGIDAHGLGVLLDLRQELQSKGIEFRLMNVTKLVRQVLAITKLNTVFQLTTEAEMAAAASAESAKRKRRARGDAPRSRSELRNGESR